MQYNPSESAERVLTVEGVVPPPPPPEAPPTWWQKHKKEVAVGLGVVALGIAIPAILIKKKK